ncbi:MAG: hypothetical protein ACREBU_00725 [Nitrososphaera sp.]
MNPNIKQLSATVLISLMLVSAVYAVPFMLLSVAVAQEEPETFLGILNTVYPHIGPELPPDFEAPTLYLLTEEVDPHHTFNLMISEELQETGGLLLLNREPVEVVGFLDEETNTIEVLSIEPQVIIGIAAEGEEDELNSHLLGTHRSGSQKWAVILCRFGDSTGVTPQPASYFSDEMDFMSDYWEEVSYNIIDNVGSQVFGWYNLPSSRATYLPGGSADLGALFADCTAAANADVFFPDYMGIMLMFNQPLDCCSWGGGMTTSLDGPLKTYATTWMATWGWGNAFVMSHEMGHGYGLPHSSGPYSATYDSRWDTMSAWPIGPAHPDFGLVGVHTIAFHKDALGWIPPSRVYTATGADDQLIFLERLETPPVGVGTYQEAKISIGGPFTHFYSLEARTFTGLDDPQIPGEAVVMHNVDTSRGDRDAQVVDVDAIPNTNPNDAGSMWIPGELFTDSVNSVEVAILEQTSTGFWVLINPTVADLSVTKTDSPDPVIAGTQLTYSVTVHNAGPDTANNVQVVDVLHPEVVYNSDTDTCVQGPPGTLNCTLGSIVSGGSSAFSITVDVPASLAFDGTTSVANSISVTSDQFDPDTSDNSLIISTGVVAEADLAITSFTASATPGELVIGDSVDVTLTNTIVNNGPSTPIDVDVDVTSAGTGGIGIAPPAASSLVSALAVGDVAQVIEVFTLTCTGPGIQEATFTNTISPVGGTDPNLLNNVAELTVQIECLIPVQLDIHPGSDVNPINLKSNGVIPVAILSTDAGENGLPIAIDASMIDPMSVHFGPSDVLLNVEPPGGATEAHGQGHLQAGTNDLILHFRTQETGLHATDTEACVKGQISIGGVWYTFFGCDSITVKP